MTTAFTETYKPNKDEAARQAFVGTLKKCVNGKLEQKIHALYEDKLLPVYLQHHGKPPATRDEAKGLFEKEHLSQLWGSAVYTSQDLLWETVGDTVDRILEQAEEKAKEIDSSDKKLGSLTLNPELVLPEPIGSTEIHRQPGGYFFDSEKNGLTAPLLYYGTIQLYTAAKGFSSGKTKDTFGGHAMAQLITQRFPDTQPTRILDLGCGIGALTRGLKEYWPEAEVHGLDLSGPFMRCAHAMAEDSELSLHFHQLDAASTGFEDNSFDLIVSQILFHETWDKKLVEIMQEVKRLIAPGGVFFNIDKQ